MERSEIRELGARIARSRISLRSIQAMFAVCKDRGERRRRSCLELMELIMKNLLVSVLLLATPGAQAQPSFTEAETLLRSCGGSASESGTNWCFGLIAAVLELNKGVLANVPKGSLGHCVTGNLGDMRRAVVAYLEADPERQKLHVMLPLVVDALKEKWPCG
jgi:hypothetical protein